MLHPSLVHMHMYKGVELLHSNIHTQQLGSLLDEKAQVSVLHPLLNLMSEKKLEKETFCQDVQFII